MTVQYMQGFETLGNSDDMPVQGITSSTNPYIMSVAGAYPGSKGLVFGYSGATVPLVARVNNNNGFWATAKIRRSSIQCYPFSSSSYASFKIRQFGISKANGNWIAVSIVPSGTSANYITYGTNFDFAQSQTSQYLPNTSYYTDSLFHGFIYDTVRSQYIGFYHRSDNNYGYISGFTSLSTPSTTFNDLWSAPAAHISSIAYDTLNNETFAITGSNSSILKRINDTNVATTFTAVVTGSGVNLHEICVTTNKIIAVGSGGTQYTALKTSSSTFTKTTPFASEIWSIAYDGTHAIASGSNGELYSSADEGSTWTSLTLNTGILVVRYASGVWLASNATNNLMYRCTGDPSVVSNWNAQLFTTGTLVSNFSGNSNFLLKEYEGSFVAALISGSVTSTDGLSWIGASTDSNTVTSGDIGIYIYPIRGSSGISKIIGFNVAYGGGLNSKTITLTPVINGTGGSAVNVSADVWTTIGIDAQLTGFGTYNATLYVNGSVVQTLSFNAQQSNPPPWVISSGSGDLSVSAAFSTGGYGNNVGISASGGATYNEIQFPDSNFASNTNQCVAISRDGNSIVAVPYGNVNYFWLSRDRGNTWIKTSALPSSQSTYVVTISGDGSTIYAAYSAQNGSYMYSSADGGNSWISLVVAVSSGSISALPSLATNDNGTTVVYSSFMGYCVSTNKGTSWSYTTNSGSGKNPSSLPVVSDDGTKIYIANGNSNIVYSLDSGASFTTLPISPGFDTMCGSADGTILYTVSGGNVYKYVNQVLTTTYTGALPFSCYWTICDSLGTKILVSQNNGNTIGTFDGTAFKQYNPATTLENIYFGVQDSFNSINYWDDIVITDYLNPNLGNLGDLKIVSQAIDGNSTPLDFIPTPSTYTNVQAATVVPYSASQGFYVGATNVGDTDIYTSSGLDIPTGYRPLVVSTEAVVQKTFPNNPQVQIGLAEGATQLLNPVVTITSGGNIPNFIKYINNTDPSGASWTTDSIKNANTVIKKVG